METNRILPKYKSVSAANAATYREPRFRDIWNFPADITKAQNLLGYNPTHRFSDGLPETVAFFKQLYKKA
jgi:UDP-N-acetylglucosamine 4-epimerase